MCRGRHRSKDGALVAVCQHGTSRRVSCCNSAYRWEATFAYGGSGSPASIQVEIDTMIDEFGALERCTADDLPSDAKIFYLTPRCCIKPANSLSPARAKTRLTFGGQEETLGEDYDEWNCQWPPVQQIPV